MNATSETVTNGLTVTIPYGEGEGAATATFAGPPENVRRDIVVYFGIDREAISGLTLSDLVINASQLAQAKGAIASRLGGQVVASSSAEQSGPQIRGAAAWAAAAETGPAESGAHPLLESIERASDIPALQRVWAENQGAFSEPTVMAAWKAKGRVLQQAA